MSKNIVQKRSRLVSVAAIVATTAVTLMAFQNCGKIGTPGQAYSASESGSGGDNPLAITLAQPPFQSANLGTTLTIPITITVPSNYSGTLKLSVLTPELGLLDPGTGIKFSFNPPTLALTGGGTGQSTLTVNVTSLAPSFDLSTFHVQAEDSMNSALVGEVTVPLQVKAVYEVFVYGAATAGKPSPEKWSVPIGQVVQFTSHIGGVSISFINMDTVEHRIHSSGGPIQHEGTPGLSPSPDGKVVGGNYTTLVPAGVTTMTSQTYCHDHEGGGQIRTFQFNVPVQPVTTTTTPSGNPNASFAFINTNVIQPKCVSCHSTANPQSGVDLSSYAKVSGFLTKGNAMISPFYDAVASGEMPLNGTPLTAALIKDISDWMDDGAANN